jgi:hypothetical protein
MIAGALVDLQMCRVDLTSTRAAYDHCVEAPHPSTAWYKATPVIWGGIVSAFILGVLGGVQAAKK